MTKDQIRKKHLLCNLLLVIPVSPLSYLRVSRSKVRNVCSCSVSTLECSDRN
jgi:hypothetical protein